MSVTTKLNVLRGYPPFDSNALTLSAVPKTSEAIKSGMLIALNVNNQWIKGRPAPAVPCWAVQDQDAPDVTSSGKLTGLVGLFGFEIETPYFDAGTYAAGSFLKTGSTAGNVADGAKYPATDDVVGIVSRGKYTNKDGNAVVSLWTVFYPMNADSTGTSSSSSSSSSNSSSSSS